MNYHLNGIANALFFLLSIIGIWLQFIKILKEENSTFMLSIDQFTSSFIAYLSFFIYGFCLNIVCHYIVWPRLIAIILTLIILFMIMKDRKTIKSVTIFFICLLLFTASIVFIIYGPRIVLYNIYFSHYLIIFATIIIGQGYVHQIMIIRKTGKTGTVSLKMHQLTFLKDLSGVTFGSSMGFMLGWPIILLNGVGAITKIILIWHFRWVKYSLIAKSRRSITTNI